MLGKDFFIPAVIYSYWGLFQAVYQFSFPAQFIDANVGCAASVNIGGGISWANAFLVTQSVAMLRAISTTNFSTIPTAIFYWSATGSWK